MKIRGEDIENGERSQSQHFVSWVADEVAFTTSTDQRKVDLKLWQRGKGALEVI